MRAWFLVPLTCVVLSSAIPAWANAKREAVEIVAPRREQQVSRAAQVVGRISVPGQPLVLVRPDGDNEVWWAQSPVEMVEPGFFRGSVRFGSGKEPAGTKFSVVVVVLRKPQEVELFRDRESLASLPRGLLRSREVAVTLMAEAEPELAKNASIEAPQADAVVGPIHEVRGRVPADATPIVLVRAEQPNALWWAQAAAAKSQDGHFKVLARFGNASTPAGMKFRMVLVMPRSPEEATALKAGESLAELPDNIPRTPALTVQLARPSAASGSK